MFQILNSISAGNNTETTSAMEVPGGVVVKTSTAGPGSHSEALVVIPGLEICDGCLCVVGTRAERELAATKAAEEAEAAEKAETAPTARVKRRYKRNE